MNIWSTEIKDLEKLYKALQGSLPNLEKELQRLIATDDENMLLVYSRRCLEVIITHLCEYELNRKRGSEPLQRIIDKLNKEEIVPHNIIVAMLSVNSMSTFGAHPKEFELKQVKPVLSNLETIISWYINSRNVNIKKSKENISPKINTVPKKSQQKKILIPGILLTFAIIVAALTWLDIIKFDKQTPYKLIDSIAILPFDNFTGYDSLEFFVAGMQSSLIYDIGRISGLRVTSKTSSNAFKNENISIKKIASELNVKAVMEGEVLCIGDSICVRFSLIGAGSEEEPIWVNDYKVEKSQILNLYNQVTKKIADEVKVKLTPLEENLLAENREVIPEAYEAFLKGRFFWERLEQEDIDSAFHYFSIAIEKDPLWADPYAGLSEVWGIRGNFGYTTQKEALKYRTEYLEKALELDPNSAYCHYSKALDEVWTRWNWEEGEKEFLKTLELNPNDALARMYYAHLLMILRRSEEAVRQANIALAMDPLRPLILGLYGVVMTDAGDYEAAITHLEKALSIDPDFRFALVVSLEPYYYSGDYKKWIEAWEKKVIRWNAEGKESVLKVFNEKGHIAAIEEMFRMHEKYGDGCPMGESIKLERYLKLNNNDKAIDCLENMYENRDMSTTYMATNLNGYNQLVTNPRYIELLKKMNLPLP